MSHVIRLTFVVAFFLGPIAVAEEPSGVPPPSEQACDIREVRSWLSKMHDTILTYQGTQRDVSRIDGWPDSLDLDTHLRIGQKALACKPVDWETLGAVTGNLALLIPKDPRVEAFAQAVVKTPLPPEISGLHWSMLNQSCAILLNQDTEAAKTTVLLLAKPESWQGVDTVYPEGTKGARDPKTATVLLLREAVICSVTDILKPDEARTCLRALLKTEPRGTGMRKAIKHYIGITEARIAGRPLRSPGDPVP